jgi:Tfp pilus assembly protein FimV
MALRKEDLAPETWSTEIGSADAAVLSFPTTSVRRRAERRRRAALARRRLAAVAAVIALTVGFLLAGGPGANAPASRPGTPKAVTVQSGDTLWDLAGRYAPENVDPRAYVDAILELNGLQGAPTTGMRLKLPR